MMMAIALVIVFPIGHRYIKNGCIRNLIYFLTALYIPIFLILISNATEILKPSIISYATYVLLGSSVFFRYRNEKNNTKEKVSINIDGIGEWMYASLFVLCILMLITANIIYD
jgi:hypothetical protein